MGGRGEGIAGRAAGAARAAWRVAVDPATFAVLCVLWCVDLGAGSILAYVREDLFGAMDAYPFALWLREVGSRTRPWSAWVYALAALTWCMVASLALCTLRWFWVRRRGWRALGEVLVHLGFLLVFAGYVAGALWGARAHGVTVLEGREAPVPGMGLTLRLERLEEVRDARGESLDTVSTLVLRDAAGAEVRGTSRLNHPLIRGATVVYPRGSRALAAPHGLMVVGRYDVHRDPGVRLVLWGAGLLLAGTLWALATYLGASPAAQGPARAPEVESAG